MTRFALLLVIPVFALGACHVSRNDGTGDNVTVKADESGNVSFNVPFVNGNVKLPEGALQNGNFDIDGVKMIPGASMHGFNVQAGDKGSTVHIAFNAPKPPDEVRAYFVDQFKQKGIDVAQSGSAIDGRTHDGDTFKIDVQPADQGSTGTIAIVSKD